MAAQPPMSPERNPAAPAQADGARPAAPPPEPPDSPIEPPGSAVAPRTAARGRPFARLLRGGRRYALPWLSLRRWRVRLLLVGAALLAGLVAIAFAIGAELAIAAHAGLIRERPWLTLLIAPVGFAALAWISRRFFPGTEGSGIPQAIAASLSDDGRVRRQLLETDPPATDLTYRLLVPGAGQRWVRQCTSLVRCEESGPALYLATSVRDVTAAAAERERLQHSEMNLRTAIDLLPIAALLRDAEGRVVVASGALSALLGYRPEALVGHPLGDVLCAEDAEGERARYLAARAAGERSYTQAVDWRRADGTTVPGRLSVRFAASSDEVGDLSLALALLDELPFG